MPVTPLRLARFDPSASLTISPAAARTLLTPLEATTEALTLVDSPLDLARTLFVSHFPRATTDALDLVAYLTGVLASEAILEMADTIPFDLDDIADEPPVDLAATIVARALAGDTSSQRIIERARIRLDRYLPKHPGYELCVRDPRPLTTKEITKALSRVLPDTLVTEPWVATEDESIHYAAILWAKPNTTTIEHEARDTVSRRTSRHVNVDTLRFESATGRITIITERPRRVPLIASVLAQALFRNPRAFLDRPAFTLKPVTSLGAKGIAALPNPPGVRAISVVAGQLLNAAGSRMEIRAADALEKIGDLTSPHGGYLARGTVRVDVEDAVTPVDAYVELPNKIAIKHPRYDTPVRRALSALGTFSPGTIEDDIVTLADFIHSEWRWCDVAGKEGFRLMVERGILVPAPPRKGAAAAVESMRALGYSARTFDLQHPMDAGRALVFGEDPTVQPRVIGNTERTLFRLDLDKLRNALRRDLGLEPADSTDVLEGVLDLGVYNAKSTTIRVYYVINLVTRDDEKRRLARALVKSARPGHAAVFVPRGRKLGRDLVEVEVDVPEQLGAASWRGKMTSIIKEMDLGERADSVRSEDLRATGPKSTRAPQRTSKGPRIIVDGVRVGERNTLIIDGKTATLPDALFSVLMRFIGAHVAQPGSWLTRAEAGLVKAKWGTSRTQAMLTSFLPPGFKLFQTDRSGSFRLNPATIVERIECRALLDHSDTAVRKVARLLAHRYAS